MTDPISYDPFLGWVDITSPDNIPAGARLIAAADLLRYENLGVGARDRINSLITELNAVTGEVDVLQTNTSDTSLAALANLQTSALYGAIQSQITTKIDAQPDMRPRSLTYGPASILNIVPPNAPTAPAAIVSSGVMDVTYTVPPSGVVQIACDGWVTSATGALYNWVLNHLHNNAIIGSRRVREGAGSGLERAVFNIAEPGAIGASRTVRWYHQNWSASHTGTTMTIFSGGPTGDNKPMTMTVTPLA